MFNSYLVCRHILISCLQKIVLKNTLVQVQHFKILLRGRGRLIVDLLENTKEKPLKINLHCTIRIRLNACQRSYESI